MLGFVCLAAVGLGFPFSDFKPVKVQSLAGAWQNPFRSSSPEKATVFVFIASDCPLANAYAPELGRIYKAYGSKGVRFESVYEDDGLSLAAARAHAKAYGYLFDGVIDPRHELATTLGAKVTPEAVVVTDSGKIFYRGRIDNTYASVARRRGVTTERDLRVALDKICRGERGPLTETEAIGCAIPTKG